MTIIKEYYDHGFVVIAEGKDYIMIDEQGKTLMQQPKEYAGVINMVFFSIINELMIEQEEAVDNVKNLITI